MAIVKQEYLASSGLTVTNLHSLPGSTSLLGGWMSETIDNSVNRCLDYTASAKFLRPSGTLTAGQIQVFAIPELADGSWPNILTSGTVGVQGGATIIDDEQKNEYLQLMWSTTTDTGASETHNMRPTSLFSRLGYVPQKHCYFITSNAAAGAAITLAPSGNEFFIKGYYESII